MPVLLCPFLGWNAYCFPKEIKVYSFYGIYLVVTVGKPDYPAIFDAAFLCCFSVFAAETEAEATPRPPADDFVERGSCFVDVSLETFERLKASSETERNNMVVGLLKDILPKCSLRIGGLEAACKVKSCGLRLKISMNEGDQRSDPVNS